MIAFRPKTQSDTPAIGAVEIGPFQKHTRHVRVAHETEAVKLFKNAVKFARVRIDVVRENVFVDRPRGLAWVATNSLVRIRTGKLPMNFQRCPRFGSGSFSNRRRVQKQACPRRG